MNSFPIIGPQIVMQLFVIPKDFLMSAAAPSSTVSPLQFKCLTQFYPESAASTLPLFDPNRKESLSGHSWNVLFQETVAAELPCFIVSVTLWHDGRNIVWKLYDAVHLSHMAPELIERQEKQGLKFLTEKKFFISCFPSILAAKKINDLIPSNFTPSYMPRVFFPVKMQPQHLVIETGNYNPQKTEKLLKENPDLFLHLEHLALEGCNFKLDKKILGQSQRTVAWELFKFAMNFSGINKQKRLVKALRWAVHAGRNWEGTETEKVIFKILNEFYNALEEIKAKKKPEEAAPAAFQAK
jgi:hypothetical protein